VVGHRNHASGNIEVDQPRGPEVDDEFEFSRRLNRHVSRLFALQDAINVARRPTILVDHIGATGAQTPVRGEERAVVNRWQLQPSR
jgi:hypothetical protein